MVSMTVANAEKLRLEQIQRLSKSMREDGWKLRWFKKDGKEGTYCYIGGYWEASNQNNWYGCPDIFKDFSDEYFLSTWLELSKTIRYCSGKIDEVQFEYYQFQPLVLSDNESVRWLNYAVEKMWPICMRDIVSQLLLPIIPYFLDKYEPWTVATLGCGRSDAREIAKFSLKNKIRCTP